MKKDARYLITDTAKAAEDIFKSLTVKVMESLFFPSSLIVGLRVKG